MWIWFVDQCKVVEYFRNVGHLGDISFLNKDNIPRVVVDNFVIERDMMTWTNHPKMRFMRMM